MVQYFQKITTLQLIYIDLNIAEKMVTRILLKNQLKIRNFIELKDLN